MKSDNSFLHDYQPLLKPTWWELIQIGNCGSPMEIDEVVGAHARVDRYAPIRCAVLLDKEDPGV